MDVTAEVRWFFPGAIPPAVGAWFGSADPPAHVEPPRRDHYLRTRTGGLGMKLRDNRLEIKQRVRECGQVRYSDTVTGAVEIWRKWSIATDPVESPPETIPVPEESWVLTEKARAVRAFTVDARHAVRAVPWSDAPEAGCHVELTHVQCRRAAWWTLGFEAFGAESDIEPLLDRVVRDLVEKGLGHGSAFPRLEASASYGYPHWLSVSVGEAESR